MPNPSLNEVTQLTYSFKIVSYGVPAAGTVAVELIWQWRLASPDHKSALSRADGIQMLALFTSMLEWVRSSDESYELCQQVHKKIKDVLNLILQPQPNLSRTAERPAASTSSDSGTSFTQDISVDTLCPELIDWNQAMPDDSWLLDWPDWSALQTQE